MPAPPPQQPLPDTLILDKFAGMRNTVRAERLSAADLERAVNIDLDDANQASRREGYQRIADGNWHSLWNSDDMRTAYAVKDGVLGILNPDISFTPIATVDQNPISYTQVGEVVYWCSETFSGKIIQRQSYAWGAETSPGVWVSPIVRPTETLPAIAGKLMKKPPTAKFITNNNGRIYLAVGNIVWFTELWNYNLVEATRNFWQFEGEISMCISVKDGVYVGTDQGVWFVGGSALKPKRVHVMDGAVVPGSAVYIPAEMANPIAIERKPDQELSVSIAFMTTHGYCVAGDGGTAYNLTEAKFIFPDATRAAALFRRQRGVNQYILVADSGGTPVADSRIGDYADAEVRRGGARWRLVDDDVVFGDRLDVELNGG